MEMIERLRRFRRAMAAKAAPVKTYADPTEPESCPRCGAKIKLKHEDSIMEMLPIDESADYDEPTYVCAGLDTREECEKYLGPAFDGKVPKNVTSRAPCSWSGLASEWGKTWS